MRKSAAPSSLGDIMTKDVSVLASKLSVFPRIGLAGLPTPLEPVRRLTAYPGGPRLWVKREDATGLGFGGNKLRKLDRVLHDAIASKADVLVSGGVAQSNSQHQVAAAAAKLGMECHLAVDHGLWLPRRPSTGFREMRCSIDCSARIFMMCRGQETAMRRLRSWEVGSGKKVVGLTADLGDDKGESTLSHEAQREMQGEPTVAEQSQKKCLQRPPIWVAENQVGIEAHDIAIRTWRRQHICNAPIAFHSTGRLQHPSGRRPGASALVA